MSSKYSPDRPLNSVATVVLLLTLASVPGCKQGKKAPASENCAPEQPVLPSAPGSAAQLNVAANQAAGISWTIPPAWEPEPAHAMRIATYRIHAIAGDPEDAECAVYFFGSGQGGSVDANLDRWAHQFDSLDGQTAPPPPKTQKRVIAGVKVSTLTVSGTYLGAGAMMGQEQVSKPHFRMDAAIVEAPEGLVFFKLVGPLNTVAAAESDFNSLLASLHRQ